MKRLVVILFLVLSACTQTNLAEVIKAAAGDPATVKIDITSPWGSFHLDRSNPTAAQVPVQIVPMTGAVTVTPPPAH